MAETLAQSIERLFPQRFYVIDLHNSSSTQKRVLVEARFYQNCDIAIAVVAACQFVYHNSAWHFSDWKVYLGAYNHRTEDAAIQYAGKFGEKLSEADGRYLFPELANAPYDIWKPQTIDQLLKRKNA